MEISRSTSKALSLVETLRRRTNMLSTAEVMKLLGKSRKTMCTWVRDGRIPAYRMGKDYMFDPFQLALWIEQRFTL
jgi:excisionase family DNA binding protein